MLLSNSFGNNVIKSRDRKLARFARTNAEAKSKIIIQLEFVCSFDGLER